MLEHLWHLRITCWNNVSRSVWIITISLVSDKCPINCAVPRTMANNNRLCSFLIFTFNWRAIIFIDRADHFLHGQSHHFIFGKQFQRSVQRDFLRAAEIVHESRKIRDSWENSRHAAVNRWLVVRESSVLFQDRIGSISLLILVHVWKRVSQRVLYRKSCVFFG